MTHGVTASVNPLSLPGGMACGACHEVYATRGLDAAAASGLGLALGRILGDRRPLLLIRHEMLDREAGTPYAPGLVEFGIDPGMVTLVRARDAATLLQGGLEGARCPGLGAVILELWGETNLYDLTASRRLSLAAERSGVPLLLLRFMATPQPSAAETRWRLQAAPSRALPANAPGQPAFHLTLLRHRHGLATGTWRLEWNRDDQHLDCRQIPDVLHAPSAGSATTSTPLHGRVVSLPADRPDPARETGVVWREAG